MKTLQTMETVNLLSGVPEASGERVSVRHLQARHAGDVAAAIGAAPYEFHPARVVVVDADRTHLADADVKALARIAARGVRVVVAGVTPVGGFAPLTVLREPTFRRAAVASIYALEPGETALLVSPDAPDATPLRHAAQHALRWRASWTEAEAGDFTSNPA